MRLRGGSYECALCGAPLDGVTEQTHVRTMLAQSSGTPKVRSLLADGRELHRCEVLPLGGVTLPGASPAGTPPRA